MIAHSGSAGLAFRPSGAPWLLIVAAARLRKGNAVSRHGTARLLGDAVATGRAAGVTGPVMVRADSGYYRAWFSVTVRMNSAAERAIAAILETAWVTMKYPNAIFDQEQQRWISEAEVAESSFVAFSSHPKKRQVPCRLVVRRVRRLGLTAKHGQDELFPMWRHHGFVTNSILSTISADETHRDQAVVEQVLAELKNGPFGSRPVRQVRRQRRLLATRALASDQASGLPCRPPRHPQRYPTHANPATSARVRRPRPTSSASASTLCSSTASPGGSRSRSLGVRAFAP